MAGMKVLKHTVDSFTVHEFVPAEEALATVIAVHPWAALGGGEHNVIGIARELAAARFSVLTFQLKSSSMVWGSDAHASFQINHDVVF
eukprot:6178940-Pleurochrysis_carterae.AAC.1